MLKIRAVKSTNQSFKFLFLVAQSELLLIRIKTSAYFDRQAEGLIARNLMSLILI